MLKHVFESAKADGPDATKIQPSHWNGDHIIDTDGATIVADDTVPAAPSAGNLKLFGKTLAGAALPAFIGPAGGDTLLQPHIGRRRISMWVPPGNGNTVNVLGMPGVSFSGTATSRSVATTNFFTAMKRVGAVSAATATSIARFSTGGVSQYFIGDAAGKGGFTAIFRWGCSDAATVAGARTFVGMCPTALANVEPSSLLNMIGVGTDAADSNLQIMHNDGAGVATKIDLGANFPDHTLSVDAYELAIFCPPASSTVAVQVTRLNTGHVANAVLSTNLPAQTTLLAPQIGRNNNATALAVGIDMMGVYMETEN